MYQKNCTLKNKCALLILAGMLLVSCNSHRQIRIVKKLILEKRKTSISLHRYNTKTKWKNHFFTVNKDLLLMKNHTPLAAINNKAVSLALEGKLRDAEILFLDVISESPHSIYATNNLAVIYELAKNFTKAHSYYIKAIAINPYNNCVKNNFLSFEESKHIQRYNNRTTAAKGIPK